MGETRRAECFGGPLDGKTIDLDFTVIRKLGTSETTELLSTSEDTAHYSLVKRWCQHCGEISYAFCYEPDGRSD